MAYGEQTDDIVEALDVLGQLYRRPTMVDGGDVDDADFFRDIGCLVRKYAEDIETGSKVSFSSASGRSQQYSIDGVEAMLDAERANPRNDDGVPYLLSALHALNQYRSKEMDSERDMPEMSGEPIDLDTSLY